MTNAQLQVELWTSWASLLRSYAAAHGLHSAQHAVVEVSAEEITFRVGPRWLRCTPAFLEWSDAAPVPFRLNEDGTVTLGHEGRGEASTEEMDLVAERLAREMLTAAPV